MQHLQGTIQASSTQPADSDLQPSVMYETVTKLFGWIQIHAGITNSVVRLYRRSSRYRSHTEGKTHKAADAVNPIAPSSVNVRRSQGQIRRVAALPDCSLRSPASAPEVVRISR